jgi:MarR family transcriptional regulator, lower aerobic nicotinate degradation pathway regulator
MAESKKKRAVVGASQADLRSVMNGLRDVVKVLRSADRADIKRYGLGSAQIFVLHQLGLKSLLSISELAELTATDQSSVSVVVNKLVAKGLVSCTRSLEDARRVELVLTVKGRRVLTRVAPTFQNSIIESLSQMPRTRVHALAATLRDLLSAMGVQNVHPPMFFEEQPAEPRARRARRPRAARKRARRQSP